MNLSHSILRVTVPGGLMLALAWLLAACSMLSQPPGVRPPDVGANRPQGVGPEFAAATGIAGGVQWIFVAFRSNQGSCTEMRFGDGSSGMSCGDAITTGAEAMSVGISSGPGGFAFVSGEVDPTIVLVDVELTDGRVLHLPTVAAPPETGLGARYFAAPILAHDVVRSFTGVDANGQAVDVVPFSP